MDKFKGFKSFSSRLREMTKEPEPEIELEEEIDYDELIVREQEKVSLLEAQIEDLKKQHSQLEALRQKEQQDYLLQLASVDSALQTWKQEVQNHCGRVFERSIVKLIDDQRFQNQMLASQLEKALIELVEQKKLTVEVPAEQLEIAQDLLSAKPNWKIVSGKGKGGARFQSEELQWDLRIDNALEEILKAIALWNQE